MYYPFLRARQFELIALRELAIEDSVNSFIIPILEPVKETLNNLTLANSIFNDNNQRAYLVVNPSVGEPSSNIYYYLEYLLNLENSIYQPAFHFQNNSEFINQSIEKFGLKECMLILNNNINEDDLSFRNLVEKKEITSIMVNDPVQNRALNRYIKSLDKNYIRLDDKFEKKARNSDFLTIQEHRFTEEHLYFKEDGFSGFSDFTVLPSEYIDGGSTPRAIAIHLTYLNEEKQIWIRHFTSITNDSISNIQGKFDEAASKAIKFCSEKRLSNKALKELEQYHNNQHYPGLGTVKKISIKNHLLVVNNYFKNRK